MTRHFASLSILLAAVPLTVAAQTYATGEAPYEAFPHHLPPALKPGIYEVTASLELPHVEDLNGTTKKRLCLVDHGGLGNHGFKVISENNPLAHCAIVNVEERGDSLTFDIKCTGSNLAKGSATYRLMGDRFRGFIDMTMGGKNMTMTEVQEGYRVGDCTPPS